jgi:hypothetical protein
VDGVLKKLGMLPKKKQGEHTGETYVSVVKVLRELQGKCGFEDLSVTDEFVELIYHGKIGAEVLGDMGEEIEEAAAVEEAALGQEAEKKEEDVHLQNQYLLLKIGQMRGYDVWVAANDRNKSYRGVALNSLALKELPHFAGPDVLKKRTVQPLCFFEIEHSTSVYSGLLRLNDVKIDYPIPRAYVVAAKGRKNLFETQIQRRTFVQSELSEICQFLTYEDVDRLQRSYETITGLLP